ncbi:hypothetical protein C1H46_020583 [Malus baccata]|uniref:Pentatricopeptide repeat-containing protein n=1 Tax=Malus baccata TaxID=106549 RepID=A0A540M502_MALBA|nr:hypothetical protein C1H46_020583 [Malus baccata]
MRDKDVFIWSSMIAGYGVNGQGGEALKVFDRMVKHSAVKPDDVAFILSLSACSNSGLVSRSLIFLAGQESWKRPWKLLSASQILLRPMFGEPCLVLAVSITTQSLERLQRRILFG